MLSSRRRVSHIYKSLIHPILNVAMSFSCFRYHSMFELFHLLIVTMYLSLEIKRLFVCCKLQSKSEYDLKMPRSKTYTKASIGAQCYMYTLKDFENASPILNPLFHKPRECQRGNCYCISLSSQLLMCPRKFMFVNLV